MCVASNTAHPSQIRKVRLVVHYWFEWLVPCFGGAGLGDDVQVLHVGRADADSSNISRGISQW